MRRSWLVAVPLALPPFGAHGADPAPTPAGALQACVALTTEPERLACYDKLAGRVPSAPVSAPEVSAAPDARAAAPAAAPGAATPPAGASPAAPQAFGLYSAEHPRTPVPGKSEALKIVDMSHSPGGYPLLKLEGGQLWELHDGDPLLANGDTVTIHRASLGSFLLVTPSGRMLRARRLR